MTWSTNLFQVTFVFKKVFLPTMFINNDENKDGFMLEAAVDNKIARREYEMIRAPRVMDLHAGTDFVVLTDDCQVALGLTMRNDVSKFDHDGFKFACFIRERELTSKYAPLHIELVIDTNDALYWDELLKKGLTMADEIACSWEEQCGIKSWEDWKAAFKQVVLIPKVGVRKVTIITKEIKL